MSPGSLSHTAKLRALTQAQLSGYQQGEDVVLGATIGNYHIVRRLGHGGMGEVFLGEHTLLGRRAALKILLPSLSSRPEVIRRFFNEARAVTSISDPGIVQVFDFGYHTDGRAFLVMEYLDGETLERRLSRFGSLALSETLRLGRQLASSLAEAHAQHIIHRDLKPENIYLVRDSEVAGGERTKILDFGIAKLSDPSALRSMTTTGTIIGTPPYMSPEQCRGLAEIDHRSDIYSLGCVLYRMITGEVPFTGEGPGDVLAAHIGQPPPAPSSRAPELPASVDALVLRCLSKAPADRFSSMMAVATVIGHVQREMQLDDEAPTRAQRRRARPERGGDATRSLTTLRESSGQIDTAKDATLAMRSRRWIAGLAIAAAITGSALFARALGQREESASRPGATAASANETPVAPRVVQASDAPALSPSSSPGVGGQPGAASPAKATPPVRSSHVAVVPVSDRAKTLERPARRPGALSVPSPSPSSTHGAVATPPRVAQTAPSISVDAAREAGTSAPPLRAQDASQIASTGARPAEPVEAAKAVAMVTGSEPTADGSSKPPPAAAALGAARPATDQHGRTGADSVASPGPLPAASATSPVAASPISVDCSLAYFDQLYRDTVWTNARISQETQRQTKCQKTGKITAQELGRRHGQLFEKYQSAK